MAEWTPYRSSPLAAAASSAPEETTHACAECGKSFPAGEMLQYENAWVCAACKPVFFQRIKEGVTPRGQYNLATIGHRFVAVFVDGILIGVLALILLWPIVRGDVRQFLAYHPGPVA